MKLIETQYRIKAIYTIDSYRPDGLCYTRVDGHATLNGTNGAGKTTYLKLSPLFLGESPSNIVRHQKNGNLPFVAYYLPRMTSYIVFEYERRGETCLSIIYANGNDTSVCYRFASTKFSLDLFRLESGEIVRSRDLEAHLSSKGIDVSIQITSVKEYRDIIQNNPGAHRKLALKYSYTPPGSNLRHINTIVSGIFKREVTFENMREMVVSCIEADGAPDKKIQLSIKKELLDSWIREFEAMKKAAAGLPTLATMQAAFHKFQNATSDLRMYRAAFDSSEKDIQKRQQRNSESLTLKEAIYRELRSTRQDRENELHKILKKAELLIADFSEDIARLEEKQAKYNPEEIARKRTEIAMLPAIRTSISNRGQEIRNIEKKSEGWNQHYADKKTSIKDISGESLDSINLAQRELWDDHNSELEASLLKSKEIERDLRLRYEQARAELLLIADEKKSSQVKIKTHLEHATAPAVLLAKLDTARATLQSVQDELNSLIKSQEIASNELGTLARQRDQDLASIAKLEDRLTEEKNKAAELRRKLQAAATTLMGFMREHVPAWESSIGRVIDQDLLMRTDLNPTMSTNGAEASSLFGLNIDLTPLPDSKVSDESLRQSLENSENRITEFSLLIEKSKGDLEALNKKILLSSRNLNAKQGFIAQKETELTQAKIILKSAEQTCSAALDEIRQTLESELSAANCALEEAQKRLSLQDEEKKSALLNLEKEFLQSDTLRRKAFADQVIQFDLSKKQINAQREIDLAQCDSDLKNALTKDGIDTETLYRMRNELSSEEAKSKKIAGFISEVEEFEKFMKSAWINIGSLKAELVEQHEHRAKFQKISTDERDSYLSDCEKINSEISKLKEDEDHLRMDMRVVKRTIDDHLLSYDPDSVRSPGDLPIVTMAETVSKLISERNLASKAMRDSKSHLRSLFTHHGRSLPDLYWSRAEEVGSSSDASISETSEAMLSELSRWYSQEAQSSISIIRADAQEFCLRIKMYCDAMKMFESNVSAFSRRLAKHTDSSVNFGTIRNIQVRLSTKQDRDDLTKDMSELSDQYEYARQLPPDQLPPESFAQAVRDVARNLPSAAKDQESISASLAAMLEMEISLEENGKIKHVTHENQLNGVSSNGLSYLVLAVVFIGFINMIRGNSSVHIVWGIDELKSLAVENTLKLFEMTKSHDITLLTAFPDEDPEVLSAVDYAYFISANREFQMIDPTVVGTGDDWLTQPCAQESQSQEVDQNQDIEVTNV